MLKGYWIPSRTLRRESWLGFMHSTLLVPEYNKTIWSLYVTSRPCVMKRAKWRKRNIYRVMVSSILCQCLTHVTSRISFSDHFCELSRILSHIFLHLLSLVVRGTCFFHSLNFSHTLHMLEAKQTSNLFQTVSKLYALVFRGPLLPSTSKLSMTYLEGSNLKYLVHNCLYICGQLPAENIRHYILENPSTWIVLHTFYREGEE